MLSVNYPDLVARLRERAAEATGLPVLRVYWFDAAPNRIPLPEHRLLRALPRVTVRLGVLTQTAGRPTQKGVDAAIHVVLSDLAQRKACSDVVMVTGDGDLQPAIVAAKDHGVALHVWAVQAADGEFNQSEELIAEADERQVLDLDWIKASVAPATLTSPPARIRSREEVAILAAPRTEFSVVTEDERAAEAPKDPPPASDALPSTSSDATESDQEASGHIPTPKEIAELHRKHDAELAASHTVDPALRWSSDLGTVDRLLPTLGEVTGRAQQWQDREEDMTSVSGEPTEVGRVYARRWAARVSEAQLAALRTAYPRVPRQLDGELLRYAARFNLLTGQDDRIDQDARYMIRDGFWREIEDCGTGEKLRAPEHVKPDAPKPDVPKPDASKPDVPKPDVPKSEAVRPEPDTAEPGHIVDDPTQEPAPAT
jgi:uncharacterized LabA/DUF88 family protein